MNIKPRTWVLTLLATLPFAATAGDPAPASQVCSPKQNTRFDPLIQQLLVRRQLDGQPKGWSVIFLYVPETNTREIEELQIRLLDELIAREAAKNKP